MLTSVNSLSVPLAIDMGNNDNLKTKHATETVTAKHHALEDKETIERTAIFDVTGNYRYRLDRRWPAQATGRSKQPASNTRSASKADPWVAFIMLNPSHADATCDDPTLRACMQFAQRWQYRALSVVNLFGYRTPHPTVLKTAEDPIGRENDAHVIAAVKQAETVVLAWGNWGTLLGRDRAILTLLQPYSHKLHCLALNQSGQPKHPLYIKRDTVLQPFSALKRSREKSHQ
ncbi:MAG: DUF1643 domain-containing protein [Cyanobacteria bacterium J06635_11]